MLARTLFFRLLSTLSLTSLLACSAPLDVGDAGTDAHVPDAGAIESVDAGADAHVPDADTIEDAGTIEDVDAGGVVEPSGECPEIDPAFQPRTHYDYTDAYIGGSVGGGWSNEGDAGFHPGQGTSWRYWQHQLGQTTLQLRYWTFVPTENTRMRFEFGSAAQAQNGISISECPGQFNTEQPRCARNTHLTWATGDRQTDTSCNLEAGKTYYINNVLFDLEVYQSTGEHVVPVCQGSACVVQYRAAVE